MPPAVARLACVSLAALTFSACHPSSGGGDDRPGSAPDAGVDAAPAPSTATTTAASADADATVVWSVVDHLACSDLLDADGTVLYVTAESGEGSYHLRAWNQPQATVWQGALEACSLARDAASSYLINAGVTVPSGRAGSISRVDRRTGESSVLARSPHSLRHAVIDDTALYTTVPEAAGRIVAFDKAGHGPRVVATVPGIPVQLVGAGRRLLLSWCAGRPGADDPHTCSLQQVDMATGAAKVLLAKVGPAYEMVVDGGTAYVPDATDGLLRAIDLASGTVTTLATNLGEIRGVAVPVSHRSVARDDSTVYVTAADRGTLTAVRKDGSGAMVLARDLASPGALLVVDDQVFVVTSLTFGIYELPLIYSSALAVDAKLSVASLPALRQKL